MSETAHQRQKNMPTQENKEIRIITFPIGAQIYALPIEAIKEVIPTPALLAPAYVLGLTNIRGALYAMLGLVKRFDLSEVVPSNVQKTFVLVLNHPKAKVGLFIKDLPNTLNLPLQQIDQNANLSFAASEVNQYLQGIIKIDKQLIILLNEAKLIEQALLSMNDESQI